MKERMTFSVDARTAERVRRCGAERGGASAYIESLVQQDALRESVASHARWFADRPAFLDDAEAERAAADGSV
ncbi:hypothetical protein WIS52_02270 [Pseudonocardia nematodicida]|uniref:Uncharacterized protein n=1 Tax=Pseudonocardia nematodicida TaxID=1206997 RepID=A0ABV1K4A6_9PSEU